MKKQYLPYNKNLKGYSRDLRNSSTFSEILLWNELKAGKLLGCKFNRQKPIDNYIVDFYCKKLALVIEIDGVSHENDKARERDLIRQQKLESMGLPFLRFHDLDVKRDIASVVEVILNSDNPYRYLIKNAPGPHGPVHSSSAVPNPHMPMLSRRLAKALSECTENYSSSECYVLLVV